MLIYLGVTYCTDYSCVSFSILALNQAQCDCINWKPSTGDTVRHTEDISLSFELLIAFYYVCLVLIALCDYKTNPTSCHSACNYFAKTTQLVNLLLFECIAAFFLSIFSCLLGSIRVSRKSWAKLLCASDAILFVLSVLTQSRSCASCIAALLSEL